MVQSIKLELFNNQVWHGLNFLSKALFLGALTPYLLFKWGPDTYGMYALASSLVVMLAAMDGGIRDATRLALCQADAEGNLVAFRLALKRGVQSFLLVVGVVVCFSTIAAWFGLFSTWLHLPREGDILIVLTIFMTGVSMTSVLLLEPLAARNQLSALKRVNTLGSVLALPCVALDVTLGGGPLSAIVVYFSCQMLPFLWVWRRSHLHLEMVWGHMKWSEYWETYHSNGWLYLNSLVWLIRTHALPFLISILTGPAQAGIFYILLRVSEVISTMGAASCETLMASLKAAPTTEERQANFRHTYSYCLLFSGFFALILSTLGYPMMRFFLGNSLPISQWDILAAALFGLTSSGCWLLFWSGYGLDVIRPLSLLNLMVGFLTCLGCYLFQRRYSYPGTLGFSALANFAMLPCLPLITRRLQESWKVIWWQPAQHALPSFVLAAVLLVAANLSHQILFQFVALAAVTGVALFEWKRLHA